MKTCRDVHFGMWLRASRLGFVWVERWKAFMRIRDEGSNWMVAIRAPNLNALNRTGCGKTHRHLTMEDAEALIQFSEVLSSISAPITEDIDLILDDSGEAAKRV